MNEIEQGKENFQKALLDVCKDYLENLELAPEEDVFISPKLQRKMNRLLKKQQKPCWKWLNTPFKKVIAACLAVLVLTGAALGCVMVKEPIFEFFTEVYEKFSEFFFASEKEDAASDIITEVHTLTYVPEGYELVENSTLVGNKEWRTVWGNASGEQIVFYQTSLVSKIVIDTENTEIRMLANGLEIAIVRKEKQIYVFWSDTKYAYTLMSYNLSEDEIIKIITSFNSNFLEY